MAKVNIVREAAASEREINAVLREMNGRGFELLQVVERATLDMMGNKGVLLFFQAQQRANPAPVALPLPPGAGPLPRDPYASSAA
jgi:hypothetical protein